MFSRRSFLKTAGLGAAALSLGFGAGKLFNSPGEKRCSLNAFVPADEILINEIIGAFKKNLRFTSTAVFAPGEWKRKIEKTISINGFSPYSLIIRMQKIDAPISSDILLSDENNIIFNPSGDFNSSFLSIRDRLKNRKAEYLLSAEYRAINYLNNILGSENKILVIENDTRVADKIPLKNSYRNIDIKGYTGITSVRIENGYASVDKASCRNKLCKLHGRISEEGSLIACAPNKILIRVELS